MRARRHRGATGRIAACLLLTAAAVLVVAALQSPEAAPPPQSPLAAYPGFGHDPAADESRFESEERKREEHIAACMARKGFRYIPEPSIAADDSMTAEEAWEAGAAHPNEMYTASLSASEWTRYSLALAGVADANDEGAAPTGGCIREAYDAIAGVFEAYNALREPFEELQERIASDERVDRAERRFASCMKRYGHSYASPQELAAAPDRPGGATPAEHEAATDAAAGCRTQVGLDAALAEAAIDHEAAFVEKYRTVLDSYR